MIYAQFHEDLAFWDVILSSWDESPQKVGIINTWGGGGGGISL